MRNRARILAAAADALSVQCIYYIIAATMVMARRGWGLAPVWPLGCSAVCAVLWPLLLKKARSTTALAVLTGAMAAAILAVFLLASQTPVKLLYGCVLIICAGMTAGLPLYLNLQKPSIHRHLTTLDVLILAFLWLLLTQSGAESGYTGRALVAAVLLLDVGAAVTLRMSEGGQGAGALRGCLTALGAAGALTLLVMALTGLFARSGGVTSAVFGALGTGFSWLGAVLTRFFTWLVSLFPQRAQTAAPPDMEDITLIPSEAIDQPQMADFNGTGLAIALAVLILAAVVYLALRFRKKRFAAPVMDAEPFAQAAVSRMSGVWKRRWRELKVALRFAWNAFLRRNTPPGVLIWLERQARRKKTPRRSGETMRAFITRMDQNGGLLPLADALDRMYYGGGAELSAPECRAIRRLAKSQIRKGP